MLRFLTVTGLQLACFMSVVAVIFLSVEFIPVVKTFFSNSTNRLIAYSLFLLTTFLIFLPPRRPIILWDEYIYMGIGQSIAHLSRADFCYECSAEFGEFKIFQSSYNKQPNGYPFLESLFFRVFGCSDAVAYSVNSICYLLAVLFISLLGARLFRSSLIGVLSGLFLAITPLVLRWSGTASAEIPSMAFCIISTYAVLTYLSKPSLPAAVLAASLTSWMMQFRPENILHLVPIAAYLLTERKEKVLTARNLFAAFILSILLVPHILHLYSVRNEEWGSSGEKLSFLQLFFNFPVNAGFFIYNQRFPLILTILAGLGLLIRGSVRERLFLSLWFAWSWGIFLFFYAGSYDYGADARFSVIAVPPICLLAARAAEFIRNKLLTYANNQIATAVTIAVPLLFCLGFFPLVRAAGVEAIDARLDVEAVKEFVNYIPPDSLVISQVPSIWLIHNLNSAQTNMTRDQRQHFLNNVVRRYQGRIYFHYGFWCNIQDAEQTDLCQYVLKEYPNELIAEVRGRGNLFRLYKLNLSKYLDSPSASAK